MLPQKRPKDPRRKLYFTLVDGRLYTLLLGGVALRLVATKPSSEEMRHVVDVLRDRPTTLNVEVNLTLRNRRAGRHLISKLLQALLSFF
jgi:hypothetical protein